MLTIRSEQLRLQGLPKREAFEQWLSEQLTERFPRQTQSLGPGGLSKFVARSVDRADGYGIRNASAVSSFAGFLIEFGENLEYLPDNSEALGILEDAEFPGQIKVQLLYEHLNQATGGRRMLPPE